MLIRNTELAYGAIARLLHWLIGLAIIGMIALGWIMVDLPDGPEKLYWFGLHKSVGATILILATVRLLWRQTNPVPTLPSDTPRLQRLGAHASHAALYLLMFAMPIVGWTMSSAHGYPVSVFGLFTLPDLIGPNHELGELLETLHGWGAWALVVVVSLHALAALYHHFMQRDDVLRRMLPW